MDFSKVPEVTLLFWVVKIIATTLGETAGDAVTMSMNLGYLVGTTIFTTIFVLAVTAQIRATKFHPYLFWFVIVATTTAGTTLADLFDRSLGIGYIGGRSILFALLLACLGLWYWSLGSVSVNQLTTRKTEVFYWATVMFSQTLGTAAGDWVADPKTGLGLGYQGGAVVFATGLALFAAAYYWATISHTVLFWAAFILTRPLGATVGDFLDKPRANGELELSRCTASAVLAALIIIGLLIFPQRAERVPPAALEPGARGENEAAGRVRGRWPKTHRIDAYSCVFSLLIGKRSPMKILIVEDEAALRQTLVETLRESG